MKTKFEAELSDQQPWIAALARTRNNLRAMADQLEAAKARIAELEAGIRGELDQADRWIVAAALMRARKDRR